MSKFDWAALMFSVAAYIPYWLGIWFWHKRPNPVVWLIFLMVISAILFSQRMAGEIAVNVVVYEIGIFVTLVSAWLTTKPVWDKRSKQLVAFASIALALYFFTGPIIAILLSLAAMFIGCIPMFKSLKKDPDAEPRLPWVLFWCGSICEFIANGPFHTWHLAAVLPIAGFFIQQSLVLAYSLPIRKSAKAQ